MKIKLSLAILFFACIGFSAKAQLVQNNSGCSHVVTIYWANSACTVVASSVQNVAPGEHLPMPGRPSGTFVHSCDVDNGGTIIATVGDPLCGGTPMASPASACATTVILHGTGDLEIN